MSFINSAMTAISNSNNESLSACLIEMSKEELQELAGKYKVTSASIHMAGSWVEESTGNLVDYENRIIQSDVEFERGFKGFIEQYYGPDSLHFAALLALDTNVTKDYDEDYFTPGSMVFGEEYGTPADEATSTADSNFEERYIRENEIEDDIDIDQCELEDGDADIKLGSAFIQAMEIDLFLSDGKKITLPLLRSESNERWFIFSILYMSSGKTLADLGRGVEDIKEFMESHFEIVF